MMNSETIIAQISNYLDQLPNHGAETTRERLHTQYDLAENLSDNDRELHSITNELEYIKKQAKTLYKIRLTEI